MDLSSDSSSISSADSEAKQISEKNNARDINANDNKFLYSFNFPPLTTSKLEVPTINTEQNEQVLKDASDSEMESKVPDGT
jgi:hypothetical protein